MKNLNSLKPILFLAILLFSFAACKKDDPAPIAKKTVNGLWIGHYTTTGDATEYYYSFDIKAGMIANEGTLDVYDEEGNASPIGAGTWKLTNNVLNIDIYYLINPSSHLLYTATFDDVNGLLSNNTWGTSPNNSNGGTWSMDKQ